MAKKEETIKVSDERKKALEMAIEKIEKDFGKGSIMCLGEKAGVNVESISTGALPLDMALGIGGVPRGRIIEIYGPESSGKTTLAQHIVAELMKAVCGRIPQPSQHRDKESGINTQQTKKGVFPIFSYIELQQIREACEIKIRSHYLACFYSVNIFCIFSLSVSRALNNSSRFNGLSSP